MKCFIFIWNERKWKTLIWFMIFAFSYEMQGEGMFVFQHCDVCFLKNYWFISSCEMFIGPTDKKSTWDCRLLFIWNARWWHVYFSRYSTFVFKKSYNLSLIWNVLSTLGTTNEKGWYVIFWCYFWDFDCI